MLLLEIGNLISVGIESFKEVFNRAVLDRPLASAGGKGAYRKPNYWINWNLFLFGGVGAAAAQILRGNALCKTFPDIFRPVCGEDLLQRLPEHIA